MNLRTSVVRVRRDASPEGIREEVEKMGLSPVNRLVTRMTFRFMLLKRAYTRPEFAEFFDRAGFQNVRIEENGIGLDIWAER
jgi:hypothetical protein